MARSHTPRHQRRRRQMMGVGILSSFLLIAPTATWADSFDDDAAEAELVDPVEDPAQEVGDEDVGEQKKKSVKDEPQAPTRQSSTPTPTPLANALDTPYLEWTVTDDDGDLVGGATFTVRGPAQRTSRGFDWGSNYQVKDCTGGDCAGYLDKDPQEGVFKVPALDSNTVDNSRRYLVEPVEAPHDWGFVDGDETRVIPGNEGSTGWFGSITQPVSKPNPWGDSWDFDTFRVGQDLYTPVCEPGYVYGISSSGMIRQVKPADTSASDFGSQASGVSSFNGIGIGPEGSSVFAYERSTGLSVVTLYEFDTNSGTWSSLNETFNSNNEGPAAVEFVAGGVDLHSGKYYAGGFGTTRGTRFFSIWEYDPSTSATVYKGYIGAGDGSGNANGDLAFDSDGNLFVVRGSGGTTQILSVTAANLQNASGGPIATSASNSVSSTSNVNGVAFDASGKAYLGSSSALQSFNTPNWNGRSTIVSSGFNSTDLATCSSPATITIEKILDNGRVDDDDQFKLVLSQGATELAEATTTGSETGVQEDRIGPFPTSSNVELTFAEQAAGTTQMNEYASSYRCYVDGQQDHSASGNGTSGTITIPASGQEVRCEFRNTPLTADITIHKDIVDKDGGNPTPTKGWKVGASLDDVVGSAGLTPQGTQQTSATGSASWRVVFETQNDSASVEVSEEERDGIAFDQAACVITHLNGSTTDVEIDGTSGKVPGVVPGDDVDCRFVNKPITAELSVDKEWVIDGADPVSHQELDVHGLSAQLVIDHADQDWGAQQGSYVVGDTVTISEAAAVDQSVLPACELGEATIHEPGENPKPMGSHYEATLGHANHYVITNYVDCNQELTLIKDVDNDYDVDLFPSDWSLDPTAWDGKLWATGEDGELGFASGETKTVRAGTYQLSEDDVAGYVFDTLTCHGADVGYGNTIELELGQNVECTFTNVIAPGSVEWAKSGGEDAGLLSGSEWNLTGPDGIDEDISGDPNNPGEFSIDGLAWGTYTLTEVKAPAGYKITADPITFEITGDSLTFNLGEVVNEQRDGPDLPLTGGFGRDHIYITGALAVLLGMSAYFYATRRRKA